MVETKILPHFAADSVVLRAQVSTPGARLVVMDYGVHRAADGWKKRDVAVEGVSLVTVYRSSFRAGIDHAGFDGRVGLTKGATGAAGSGRDNAR
jgi:ABC-type transporter MlaC component